MDTTLNHCYYSLKHNCYLTLDILNWTVSTTKISNQRLFILCINVQKKCKSFAKVFSYILNNKTKTKSFSHTISLR